MPELPEVETTRRGIEPHLVGHEIRAVIVREPRLRWPVSEDLAQCATGRTISGVGRRGKYLLLETHPGPGAIMIHLGMSGSLRVIPTRVAPDTHDHVDIVLANDQLLRLHDPRRFGSVFWLPDNRHDLLASLGPEPLTGDFDGNHLHQRSRGRRIAVKQFLMDSHVVVGVGNIYANEALHAAGISPLRAAGRIALPRYQSLATEVKRVLAAAIEAGGTTLKDFVREDGNPGYFKHELKVYGRGGEPCFGCGKALTEIRMQDRTTVYCTACQR